MLAGNTGYHFQLLTVGDRGQRAAEAAGDEEAREAPRARWSARRSRCWGWRSSRTPTTCGRHPAWCSRRRLQGEGAIVRGYDPVAEGAGAGAPAEHRAVRLGRERARGRRRRDPGHRVAGVRRARLGRRFASGWPPRWSSTGGTSSIPSGCARRASPTRGSGGRTAGTATGRRGSGAGGSREVAAALMQALILAGGEGTRLRPLTLTRPKPAMTLVDRPFIAYMVDWVARHGITRRRDRMRLRVRGRAGGARRRAAGRCSGSRTWRSPSPSGTAGPLRLAADRGAARRALPGPERRPARRPRPLGR